MLSSSNIFRFRRAHILPSPPCLWHVDKRAGVLQNSCTFPDDCDLARQIGTRGGGGVKTTLITACVCTFYSDTIYYSRFCPWNEKLGFSLLQIGKGPSCEHACTVKKFLAEI